LQNAVRYIRWPHGAQLLGQLQAFEVLSMTASESSVWINGEPCEHVNVANRGLLYGDGLFETVAVRNQTLQFFDWHLQRLIDGCKRLRIPIDTQQFRNEILDFLAQQSFAPYVLKLIVTRGEGGRGFHISGVGSATRIITAHPMPDYPANHAAKGVKVRLCETRLGKNPLLAGLKHLNRLEQVMARSEWNDEEFAEGLMADESGSVIEGTMSNLFWVVRGRLLTSNLENAGVAGVMRRVVMQRICPVLELQCEVSCVDVPELQLADEVFVTNSLIGVWPVIQFEGQKWDVGPITKKIQHKLAEIND